MKKIFIKSNILRFKLPNTSPTDQDQEFELNITASWDGDPDYYSIQWIRLSDKPANSRVTPLTTLHFAIRWIHDTDSPIISISPISWCEKPTCDNATKWNTGTGGK